MNELIFIIFSTAIVNNFVLVQFLGLCPFMGVSNKRESAIGMGFATTFVLTLSAALSHIIYQALLEPYNLVFMRTITFIVVIAGTVQLTELIIARASPLLHRILGIFLPLITTNCAVLGVALLSVKKSTTFAESVFFGFGAAVGFSLVLILLANLRDRLQGADIPKPFQGAPITLICAGLMSLAFMGFAGFTT